jgi:ketosteroid isomerase-like protein
MMEFKMCKYHNNYAVFNHADDGGIVKIRQFIPPMD